MPQAISWIMEFPLCFLGEMMGEINRKNIVTNPNRCHESPLGPSVPHQGSGPEAQLRALCGGALRSWDARPPLAAGSSPCLAIGRLGLAPPPPAPTSARHDSGASQSLLPPSDPTCDPSSFPLGNKTLEALFCTLGRRGTLRSVRGDGEKEHDVHPKNPDPGSHLLWPGIKGFVPFLTAALPHLTTAVHPSMFSHHFIVCQRINKSHPLSPREGCILENC